MKKIFTIITIFCAAALASCTKGLEPASLKLDENSREVDYAGEEFTIAVRANRSWTATTDADWLSLVHDSEEALDARSYILVTAQPNSDAARSATITVATAGGDLKEEYIVSQGENSHVIRTPDRFVAFLTAAAASEAAGDFRLGADIDLSGVTLPEVESMIYPFDGQGHSLKNWKTIAPLFKTIAASGSVSNLVIDSSCELNMPGGTEKFGFIACENAGTIENVVNNAPVVLGALQKGYVGIICGENTGTLLNCVNKGALNFSGAPHTDGTLYVGGVAGRSTGEAAKAENCSNEGTLQMSFTGRLGQSIYLAGVTGAANANAKTLKCSNSGSVTVRVPGTTTNGQAAGVACYCGGEITDCSNTGDIAFYSESAEGKADGSVKGIGVAGVACYSGWAGGKTSGCSNTGSITLRAGYSLAHQQVGNATKYATNVAGVVGHAYQSELENCNNSGKIHCELRNIDNAESVYNTTCRHSVGGVISSTWGNVTNCTNKGDIEVIWTTASHNSTLAKNFVCQVGGISGGDYHSDQQSSSIIDCTNEGAVNITCDSSQSNNAFGGIVGWPGKENAAGLNEVRGCVNRGDLTVDGYSKSRIGGISGGATKCISDKNYGKVTLKGGLASCSVGGIIGFQNFFNVDACESYGTVASDIKLAGAETSAAGGIAAIAGALGNTAQVYSGCKVDCAVNAPEGSAASMILGVIGQNKAVSTKLEVGTSAAPIKVKGSFNGIGLTSSNYDNYIRRPNFSLANQNITFNVQYGD